MAQDGHHVGAFPVQRVVEDTLTTKGLIERCAARFGARLRPVLAMPFTPFHFGPGAAVHAMAPRHVSFLAFCASNVLMDFESLYNLVHDRHPVHAFFHTFLGATLVIFATVLLFVAVRAVAPILHLPNLFRWKSLTVRQVSMGAALGAYSHVVLDSVMHGDIRPLWPISASNVFLGAVALDDLHWYCIIAGVFGLVFIGVRKVAETVSSD